MADLVLVLAHVVGAALDNRADALHRLKRFHRVRADGRLGAEHDRVGTIEDGIGNVAHFGASWPRR